MRKLLLGLLALGVLIAAMLLSAVVQVRIDTGALRRRVLWVPFPAGEGAPCPAIPSVTHRTPPFPRKWVTICSAFAEPREWRLVFGSYNVDATAYLDADPALARLLYQDLADFQEQYRGETLPIPPRWYYLLFPLHPGTLRHGPTYEQHPVPGWRANSMVRSFLQHYVHNPDDFRIALPPPGQTGDAALDRLLHAAWEGDADGVREALNEGADADATSRYGWRPLHEAAQGGNAEVVRLLLDAGAAVRGRDGLEWTALHWAGATGANKAAAVLLARGADPNEPNEGGYTPLHLAAAMGHAAAVRLLLEAGSDIRAEAGNGWTPFVLAAAAGHVEAAEVLLAAGADINSVDEDGCSALYWAVYNGCAEGVDFLLDRGARRPETHEPLLHRAARDGYTEAVRVLLEHGADVNALDEGGWTPLDQAEYYPDVQGVLRDHGGMTSEELAHQTQTNRPPQVPSETR